MREFITADYTGPLPTVTAADIIRYGLLLTAEKCAEQGIKPRALHYRFGRFEVFKAGRVSGGGSGTLWHPEVTDD